MTVVAEGIETSDQLDVLRDLACDCYQGFFAAKPMNPEAATEFLQENRRAQKA